MTLQTQTPTCILKLRALQLAHHRLNPSIVQPTYQITPKKRKKKTIDREKLAWKWCVAVCIGVEEQWGWEQKRWEVERGEDRGLRKKERKRLTERWEKKWIKKSLKCYNIYSYASIFKSALFINIKYFDI